MPSRTHFSRSSLSTIGLTFREIFQELPVRIRTSGLGAAWMYDLARNDHACPKYDILNIDADPYLEKNLELLMESFDAHGQEQYKWNRYQQQVIRQQHALHHQLHRRVSENMFISSGLNTFLAFFSSPIAVLI
jgi:translation initiation factor 3 subunit H